MLGSCTVELFKEDMKFSAGHFTVFSATERERMHGHNFRVRAHLTALVNQNGLTADYRIFKNKLRALCDSLDEFFLLPENSPYLKLRLEGKYLKVWHAEDELCFLQKDIKVLPISNITVEELASYLVKQLAQDRELIDNCQISHIEVKVGSGDGQTAGFTWQNSVKE